MSGAHTIQLSESDRVVWLCPRGSIVDSSGVSVDLDASVDAPKEGKLTWLTFISTLNDFLGGYAAPILREHKSDGMTYGSVPRVVPLTADEQRAAGIPDEQVKGEAAFAVCDLGPELLEAYDAGRLTRTSPHFVLEWTDDEGTTWPIAMLELSAVSKPRQTRRHVTADFLRGVRLSESAPRITMSSIEEDGMDEKMETRLAALEESVSAITPMMERMSAFMEKYMEAEKPEVEATEGGDDDNEEGSQMSESSAVIELSERVKELEREKAETEANAKVEIALRERQIQPEQREPLKSLALFDGDLFDKVVAGYPKANRITSPAGGVGVQLGETGEPKTALERARALQKENPDMKLSEALKQVGRKEVTL